MTPSASVRAALDGSQLLLHYLPVVDLASGQPQGVEALLRWQHPDRGLLGPDHFLPAMANTDLMRDVTAWVLRTAVQALAAWPGWTMSVNVTAADVTRDVLVQQVDDALSGAGVAPERLVLELTEQDVVANLSAARSVLSSLRDRGVGLSLDDFGTGYSSLLYLRELPITELKIDRAFISHTAASEDNVAIVRSVAALGQAIGVAVVAEGVETPAHALLARELGCSGAQGFLWGVPAVAAEVDPARVQLAASVALGPSANGVRRHVPSSKESLRIQQLLGVGASLHTVAAALNREGLRTPRETRWTARTVATAVADIPPTRVPRTS